MPQLPKCICTHHLVPSHPQGGKCQVPNCGCTVYEPLVVGVCCFHQLNHHRKDGSCSMTTPLQDPLDPTQMIEAMCPCAGWQAPEGTVLPEPPPEEPIVVPDPPDAP